MARLWQGRRGAGFVCALASTLALTLALGTVAQPPVSTLPPETDAEGGDPARAARPRGPFEAYSAGLYDQALQGFVDLLLERPDDPRLALNVGSSHYKMRDYAAAAQSFATAAQSTDPRLRQQAVYNLGNVAYRQGRLEEAVELFKQALELDPNDQDAKYNLEFVRDEIRRRHEEAQKRQQQPQSSNQGDSGEPQGQPGEGQDQKGEEAGQQDPSGGGEPKSAPGEGQDQDGDGLPDEIERTGTNPTDPTRPDSDGDGLADGEEDHNGNGSLDPGETDPNRPDSDGDGVPDGAEAAAGASQGATSAMDLSSLSPEEAERFLQALEEGRPQTRGGKKSRQVRSGKDW